MKKKGVALFLVLAILFGVILLSGVVLNLITSQSKLTDHQVKRMQAYYAAQAGINYGFEQLRLNNPNWLTDTTTSRTFRICGSVYAAANVAECTTVGDVGNITDDTFPPIINFVSITIGPRDAGTNERTVNATVDYSDS